MTQSIPGLSLSGIFSKLTTPFWLDLHKVYTCIHSIHYRVEIETMNELLRKKSNHCDIIVFGFMCSLSLALSFSISFGYT